MDLLLPNLWESLPTIPVHNQAWTFPPGTWIILTQVLRCISLSTSSLPSMVWTHSQKHTLGFLSACSKAVWYNLDQEAKSWWPYQALYDHIAWFQANIRLGYDISHHMSVSNKLNKLSSFPCVVTALLVHDRGYSVDILLSKSLHPRRELYSIHLIKTILLQHASSKHDGGMFHGSFVQNSDYVGSILKHNGLKQKA